MATIGTFETNGSEFTGEIATLTIRATSVRIAPVQRATDKDPTHRAYAGQAEVGAAWSGRSREVKVCLSLLLDDPSLAAPFYASLFTGEDGAGHAIVWSRGSRRKAD